MVDYKMKQAFNLYCNSIKNFVIINKLITQSNRKNTFFENIMKFSCLNAVILSYL